MTRTAISSGSNRLAKRDTYRRLLWGSILAGVVGSLALRFLEYPLVGEGVYWLGIVGAVAVWRGTSTTLFDERDAAIERRASQLALYASAFVLVAGASLMRVLPRVSEYTVAPVIQGFLYGYMAVFATFAAAFLWVRYRS
ncbi:hypothetical protein [Halococcus agarilyticus]|uniref:hypothetical protein n=1 Tax=Halococcus agarilyticus TaxID=1232219 RepID=UPI000677B821|nr:hypothetical protein [Halococcus agarilyticus]